MKTNEERAEELKQCFENLKKDSKISQSSELTPIILGWMVIGAMYIQPIIEKKMVEKALHWAEQQNFSVSVQLDLKSFLEE